ncbi:MAG TPA: HNH endonuclease [Candidatus Saccharimonadales bacterium]
MPGPHPQSLEQQLEKAKKRIVINEKGCFVYLGAISKGYGILRYRRQKQFLIHRLVACEKYGLPYEHPHDVHHKCTITTCINPDHLVFMDHAAHQSLERKLQTLR